MIIRGGVRGSKGPRTPVSAEAEAIELLQEAFFLRQFGERPPGHNEATWQAWDKRAELFLRSLTPPSSVNNGGYKNLATQVAAREKRAASYITLVCEHSTTHDAQEVYRNWRPKGRTKYFCENCGNWQFPLTRR